MVSDTTVQMNITHLFCIHQPYKIHTIFKWIKFEIQNATFIEEKLLHLFQYFALVHNISDFFTAEPAVKPTEKNTHSSSDIKEFFIKDIIYFVCNILNNTTHLVKLKLATHRYFNRFCKIILPKCANEFQNFLNFIVSTVLPIAKQVRSNENGQLIQESLELLRFLIIDQKVSMQNSIALLDNFPSGSEFEDLHQTHFDIKYNGSTFSLTEEIEYFLKIDKRQVEGFTALRHHLASKKNELTDVYRRHQEQMCNAKESSGGIQTNLQKLIFVLLNAAKASDREKSLEAVRCLGELGPSDLATIILKPDGEIRFFVTFDSAIKNLVKIAMDQLNNLLMHPNASVMKVASDAIRFLLKTKVGQSLAENYTYLSIFKPSSLSSQIPSLPYYKPPENKSLASLEQIFHEEQLSTHLTWIKRFTVELLEFFGDEYLKEVVSMQLTFAEAILPTLIQMILAYNKTSSQNVLQATVVMYFKKHFDYVNSKSSTNSSSVQKSIYLNRATVKSMLNIAECIRLYNFQ